MNQEETMVRTRSIAQQWFAVASVTVSSTCIVCGRAFDASRANYQRGGGFLCSLVCLRTWQAQKVRPVTVRFWDYVVRGEPDECWLWQGFIDATTGYGRIWDNEVKTKIGAHVAGWMVAGNPRPGKGEIIAHRCDVRACVNFERHLFLTDNAGNLADMRAKGRHPHGDTHPYRTRPELPRKGTRHPLARLTDAQVLEIRQAVRDGETQLAIATRLGMSHQHISDIVTGKRWKHI